MKEERNEKGAKRRRMTIRKVKSAEGNKKRRKEKRRERRKNERGKV